MWLLNRFLNMSLSTDSGVRKQDGYKVLCFAVLSCTAMLCQVLAGVASNTVGRYLAFDFIQENWDRINL